jgi:hypothetical protein|tara:strand:- start:6040 stop:6528 length:489 start_codon:yes stop_codon:yes gene_type:complete
MVGKQSTTSKKDYKFTREYLAEDTYAEIKPLLEENFKEVDFDNKKVPLNQNIEFYYFLQDQDKLFCFICRYKGKMVGYIITMFDVHPHYQNNIFGQNLITYITPKHRKGLLAARFIRDHDKQLRDLNISVMTYHIRAERNFANLLKRQNYSLFETVYRKDLI